MVSKIIKVKVVGYIFLGLCNLTCVKDLGFFTGMNIILTVQIDIPGTIAQSPHFDQGHTFAMIKRKTTIRCKTNHLQNATISRNKKKTPLRYEGSSIDFKVQCLSES